MTNNAEVPIVPDELAHLMDDRVKAAVEPFTHVTGDQIWNATTHSVCDVALNDGRIMPVGVLEATDDTAATDLVIALPHQQELKPAMLLRAAVTRNIVAPGARTIILPNATPKRGQSRFVTGELERLRAGDLGPQFELQARILEHLGVSRAALTGYSLGALTVAGITSLSPDFDICAVNVDEMPSKAGRTPEELRKSFMQSGGYGDQRRAIADAKIPVLEREIYSRARLARDYGAFAFDSLHPDNKALSIALGGSHKKIIERVAVVNPFMPFKLGRVAGSSLFDWGDICEFPGVRRVEYSGAGAHRHPTGDSPVAHALMALDGLGLIS